MKLLLDENLSHRIIPALKQVFPDSSQVSLLELNEANDHEIWNYAKMEGFAIVTQDADFHELSLLIENPPLIIWLRCGNQPKSVVLKKILDHQPEIEQAALDNDIWCIEIY